ncbi:popeye domain-containing protein 3-like [Thrips palmi]|uniref:Popeye domain-containing protein 3-like n=1 Tax=Thrips palmi TaxID=161013 RepID=A0A6P8ZL70_THRPL|nr:popeye domain-containing protein 3-like [Thrips palmi]XP_034238339.1 popeye domain-containing protein 3-like [Thrips palmi]
MPFGLGWTNDDWLEELTGNITFHIPGGGTWCDQWRDPQNVLYHVANTCFALAYVAPTNSNGELFMQAALIVGFILFSAWSWESICAPDAFSWNFGFALLNMLQLFHAVYRLRPVKFDPELEEVYRNLFQPFKVTRIQFKKLVSAEFAQIMSLHAGEAYAMQSLTRTDRLGLLLSGKVNVMSDHQFLHPILPCEFLDSPEFESSRANVDDKFKVSIIAATSCRYLFWQRTALEYLFVKETYLATVVSTIVARDITTKLYSMNSKIVTGKGSHLDIRLPAVTSSLGAKATPRILRQHRRAKQNPSTSPPSHSTATDPLGSRERLVQSPAKEKKDKEGKENGRPEKQMGNGRAQRPPEMEPLTELPSMDDLTTSGVESWLESSSKYHSCEIVDE